MIALAVVAGVVIVALVVALFVMKAKAKRAVDDAMNNFAKEMQLKLLEAAAKKKTILEDRSRASVNAIPSLSDKQLEEKLNK